MEEKTQKKYVDETLGFPVLLRNVRMIKIRGEWTIDIKYNTYMKAVLECLCNKKAKLTGAEVRFIRQYFQMTLQEFATRFAISHAGVIKWEKAEQKATHMNWSTEKDLRLFIFKSVFFDKKGSKPAQLMVDLYEKLEQPYEDQSSKLEIDVDRLAA